MITRCWIAALSIVGGASMGIAAPETSLRPASRPAAKVQLAVLTVPVTANPQVRPKLRPVSDQILSAAARPADLPALGPIQSLRPTLRPDSVVEQALFKRRRLRKGSVCGDISIQGDKVGTVPAKQSGCGAQNAVRVRSVAGVTLSQPAVMTCETAQALNIWVEKGLQPAFRRRNQVVSLRVAAHYACRTRNNQPGARISEHGKGKAIDISGFTLANGELVTVAQGWSAKEFSKRLRKAWSAACGPFGTVLGPEADRHHRDHFHLDTAEHRGGPYCR
ncbi:extensin-like protein [Parasedimentitalea marina]|uniref:Extensin-like protein n=1 Tax=Parasedimentitalea marina TaxID=2483033 RepID=A0A3T0N5J3_9RHOB|nr:extensin family protein [Parasedimentitalea marina]AZV79294.1 extensin-like protein [Parasedimentitalea marina]